jgi:hypothetical protein
VGAAAGEVPEVPAASAGLVVPRVALGGLLVLAGRVVREALRADPASRTCRDPAGDGRNRPISTR